MIATPGLTSFAEGQQGLLIGLDYRRDSVGVVPFGTADKDIDLLRSLIRLRKVAAEARSTEQHDEQDDITSRD